MKKLVYLLVGLMILSAFRISGTDASTNDVLFYDDFEDGDYSTWTVVGGNPVLSESGGKLSVYSDRTEQNYITIGQTSEKELLQEVYIDLSGRHYNWEYTSLILWSDNNNYIKLDWNVDAPGVNRWDVNLVKNVGGTESFVDSTGFITGSPSTTYLRFVRQKTSYYGYISSDGINWDLKVQGVISDDVFNNPLSVGLRAGAGCCASEQLYFDNYIARKYRIDNDRGHGNDPDGIDDDNPGRGCDTKSDNGNKKRCP